MMNIVQDPVHTLEAIPRLHFEVGRSAIEPLKRLATGSAFPRLFIKRDDDYGLMLAGNKLRKLEYIFSDVLASKAGTVITIGGARSNHARATAIAARRLGLQCVLVLNGTKEQMSSGDAALYEELGITLVATADREEREATFAGMIEDLRRQGRTIYPIPLGASNAIGSLGFVRAMHEVACYQQQNRIRFDYVYLASSSAGTLAGMVVGKVIYGLDRLKLIAISADYPADEITSRATEIIASLSARLGLKIDNPIDLFEVDDRYIGEGYGIPTTLSRESRLQFARYEGILLDDTYTSKAAAALLDHLADSRFHPQENILFWHTGGLLSRY